MPSPIIPATIKADIRSFNFERKQFVISPEGKAMASDIAQFRDAYREMPLPKLDRVEAIALPQAPAGSQATLAWFDRLPESVATEQNMPLIDFDAMKPAPRDAALRQSLAALEAGAMALALGDGKVDDLILMKIIQGAFGNNLASKEIRRPFEPEEKKLPFTIPEKLQTFLNSMEILNAFRLIGRAAAAAASEDEWRASVRVLGAITAIKPNRVCAGATITIEYKGLGASPPAMDKGSRLVLRIPTAPGTCAYVDINDIAPGFTDPRNWTDSGWLKLTLPDDVASGPLQFIYFPPQGGGASSSALLNQAAGILGQFFPGASLSTKLTQIATLRPPHLYYDPVGKGTAGNADWLFAGAPLIRWFTVDESSPIHPRGYVTLSWCVENADSFEIVAQSEPGSENSHELPAIQGPLKSMDSMRVAVPCTRRWTGSYVLRAVNGNPCKPNPATVTRTFDSGFSHYLVGVGKAPIAFDPAPTNMSDSDAPSPLPPAYRLAGFADEKQIAKGVDESAPLFARAFVVAQNTNSTSPSRVAIVIADIWTCTIALKTAVVRRLAAEYGPNLYSADRLLIAGTHTHAAPGGYSDYFLYNFSIGGFDNRVFNTIVDAMVAAVQQAHRAAAPGRVLLNEGDVADCGEIRSEPAYLNNVDAEAGLGKAVNRSMQLLRFEKYVDSRGYRTAIGMVNWHAIHPTSLGYKNPQISGDSKGWASASFEQDRGISTGNPNFVGAFANSCAGDISGNVGPGGGTRENVRLGAPLGSDPASQEWQDNYARMVTLATRQRDAAFALFDGATEELTGPIAARSTFKDMANIAINANPGTRTWPAAIGVSFGAGSSEDSEAAVHLGSVTIIAKIKEGMTQSEFDWGGVEASGPTFLALGGLLLALAPFLILGPAGIPATLLALVPILAISGGLLAALPISRGTSWLFGTIGKIAFGSKVETPQPSSGGTWKWLNPDELIPENTNPRFAVFGPHGVKPILFPVGLWQLKHKATGASDWGNAMDCPLVPHVLPLQVLRIGQFIIAGVPAEFTTMAGKRLTQTLRNAAGAAAGMRFAISNYTNGYSGYVTTNEEYNMQHYEGASTLYGPHTLEAYRQEMGALAEALYAGAAIATGAPFIVPAIRYRPGCGGA
ncbi:MAG: neutral/alkaline non-lysosomal ceramidase N-terminal domain-containing protein [Sphingopyxis sp.]